MYTIENDTIGGAHEHAIKTILINGQEQMSKHGITLEMPEALSVRILHPLKPLRVSTCANLTEEMMQVYAQQLLNIIPKTGTNKDFDYNCGNRWMDYPQIHNGDIIGDGDHLGFNQLQYNVIDELRKDETSRRAIVTSINPIIDYSKTHIPCISFLQFLIRNDRLNMEVYIRSNDMLSAWGSDAYALSEVQRYVAHKLDRIVGTLEIISVSAHIYYHRDAPELIRFRKKLNI
jgi:thymidylate synthase